MSWNCSSGPGTFFSITRYHHQLWFIQWCPDCNVMVIWWHIGYESITAESEFADALWHLLKDQVTMWQGNNAAVGIYLDYHEQFIWWMKYRDGGVNVKARRRSKSLHLDSALQGEPPHGQVELSKWPLPSALAFRDEFNLPFLLPCCSKASPSPQTMSGLMVQIKGVKVQKLL